MTGDVLTGHHGKALRLGWRGIPRSAVTTTTYGVSGPYDESSMFEALTLGPRAMLSASPSLVSPRSPTR